MINKYYRTVEVASFSYHTHRAGPCIAWREGMEARTALLRRPTDRSKATKIERESGNRCIGKARPLKTAGPAGRPLWRRLLGVLKTKRQSGKGKPGQGHVSAFRSAHLRLFTCYPQAAAVRRRAEAKHAEAEARSFVTLYAAAAAAEFVRFGSSDQQPLLLFVQPNHLLAALGLSQPRICDSATVLATK